MPTPQFTVVDLFAGAGGLTLGFREAGFKPIFAVERELDFARTYELNFGAHVDSRPIEEVVRTSLRGLRADVVIGGPPCQGFSNLTGNRESDPRRGLWTYFMQVVEQTKCSVFLIENVPNLLTSVEGELIRERAQQLGYEIGPFSTGVLLASQYGVPQRRRRAFIVGSRIGAISLPVPLARTVTVRDAFKGIPLKPKHFDLPRIPASADDLHIGRHPTKASLARYRAVPEGGNRFDLQRIAPHLTPACWKRKKKGGTDLFGRLVWDEPAHCTIRTEFYKPEKGRYLHPSEDRPITHWEAARLQSFPDEFRWYGTKIRIAIQIGNAVPPGLGRALAMEILLALQQHKPAHRVRSRTAGRAPSSRSVRTAATALRE